MKQHKIQEEIVVGTYKILGDNVYSHYSFCNDGEIFIRRLLFISLQIKVRSVLSGMRMGVSSSLHRIV